jgi:hypothetical protein
MGVPAHEERRSSPRSRWTACAVAACLLLACQARDRDRSNASVSTDVEVVSASQALVSDARCGSQSIELEPPSPDPRLLEPMPVPSSDPTSGRTIVARWYDARIHAQPDPSSTVIGYARRGQHVLVRRGARGTGCPADMWYELADGGYACAAREFREATVEVPHPVEPKLDAPLPFGYAKVVREGAPSFENLPAADVLTAALSAFDAGQRPMVEHVPLRGAHFVTTVEVREHEGRRLHRTDAGRWVLEDHLEVLDPPPLHGQPISQPDQLPLAFVRTPDATLRCECEDAIVSCGRARLFARFGVRSRRMLPEGEHVVSAQGHMIAATDVGIASRRAPPADVGDDDRWIHIDLPQQTLVAYEGPEPVWATLVSTGKGKFATPTGLWRVDRKYVSTTMSGPDEDTGTYTVSEVPWTMFYDGDFALHGAYWHTEFGRVRSHGCTNLPPADARWLFAWSGPLPAGWHAASHLKGPWIYITDDEP